MADSIPSLRRKLNEALEEVALLRRQLADVPAPVVKAPVKTKIVEVERVVNVPVPFKVTERVIEYHDNPEHLRMIAELQGRLQAWQAISQSDS